eukprot:1152106-Pelagomonas_calceolata.AAC.2
MMHAQQELRQQHNTSSLCTLSLARHPAQTFGTILGCQQHIASSLCILSLARHGARSVYFHLTALITSGV